jgi:cell division protein FtsL
MNAMQNASNDAQNKINRQLIDYNATQNNLIFKTRKRLFKLEHNFRLLIATISITLITTGLMGLVVSYG